MHLATTQSSPVATVIWLLVIGAVVWWLYATESGRAVKNHFKDRRNDKRSARRGVGTIKRGSSVKAPLSQLAERTDAGLRCPACGGIQWGTALGTATFKG